MVLISLIEDLQLYIGGGVGGKFWEELLSDTYCLFQMYQSVW